MPNSKNKIKIKIRTLALHFYQLERADPQPKEFSHMTKLFGNPDTWQQALTAAGLSEHPIDAKRSNGSHGCGTVVVGGQAHRARLGFSHGL